MTAQSVYAALSEPARLAIACGGGVALTAAFFSARRLRAYLQRRQQIRQQKKLVDFLLNSHNEFATFQHFLEQAGQANGPLYIRVSQVVDEVAQITGNAAVEAARVEMNLRHVPALAQRHRSAQLQKLPVAPIEIFVLGGRGPMHQEVGLVLKQHYPLESPSDPALPALTQQDQIEPASSSGPLLVDAQRTTAAGVNHGLMLQPAGQMTSEEAAGVVVPGEPPQLPDLPSASAHADESSDSALSDAPRVHEQRDSELQEVPAAPLTHFDRAEMSPDTVVGAKPDLMQDALSSGSASVPRPEVPVSHEPVQVPVPVTPPARSSLSAQMWEKRRQMGKAA